MARAGNLPAPTDVPSPCVRNCCLDDDDVCLGCGRTIQEILAWQQATMDERLAIIERASMRKAPNRHW